MKLPLPVIGLALLLSACQQDQPTTAAAPAPTELHGQQTADGTAFTLPTDAVFGPTDALIKEQATGQLLQLARAIQQSSGRQLLIRVYADAQGDDNQNLILSQRRAQAIADWLKDHQITLPAELQGLGEADPIAPNAQPDGTDNPAGREQNRRMVVIVQ
ncbi:OmpA family protein [Hymenobacter sp. CRA2]|uniref:OmpA family protein n=1 Tax=Hymenobacter sp. CRA2 TaxID=1955620 RepID=UPI00098EDBBD|nr:OmpA family protein [Hymenobacter sp. CRA2]OON67826.1 hypothetical protein B0919_16715 [Hymenobacter sp. CRA2]